MQGSRQDNDIDDQDYRRVIANSIEAQYPDVEIVDPNELHPQGVAYDDKLAAKTLLDLFDLAGQADLLVAYVPQASMGTAIEMWRAFQSGAPVVVISPLAANWVIRHLSSAVLPNLSAFQAWVAGGGIDKLVKLDYNRSDGARLAAGG
jgi:hypothetical protein